MRKQPRYPSARDTARPPLVLKRKPYWIRYEPTTIELMEHRERNIWDLKRGIFVSSPVREMVYNGPGFCGSHNKGQLAMMYAAGRRPRASRRPAAADGRRCRLAGDNLLHFPCAAYLGGRCRAKTAGESTSLHNRPLTALIWRFSHISAGFCRVF